MFQAGDPVTALCPWDNSEERPGCVFGRDGQTRDDHFFRVDNVSIGRCQLDDLDVSLTFFPICFSEMLRRVSIPPTLKQHKVAMTQGTEQ